MFTIRYTIYKESFTLDPHRFLGRERLLAFLETANQAWQRDGAVALFLEPGDGTKYAITFASHNNGTAVLVGALTSFSKLLDNEFATHADFDSGNLYTDCVLADLFNAIVVGMMEPNHTYYDWEEGKPTEETLNQQ